MGIEMNFDESFDNESFYVSITLNFFFILQSGFDLLHTLIPSLSQNPNAKVSKAAMLQKSKSFTQNFLGYCIPELLKCSFNFFNSE